MNEKEKIKRLRKDIQEQKELGEIILKLAILLIITFLLAIVTSHDIKISYKKGFNDGMNNFFYTPDMIDIKFNSSFCCFHTDEVVTINTKDKNYSFYFYDKNKKFILGDIPKIDNCDKPLKSCIEKENTFNLK